MSGGYVSEVIAEALSMAESNACMCRIVAAPTAVACGPLSEGGERKAGRNSVSRLTKPGAYSILSNGLTVW